MPTAGEAKVNRAKKNGASKPSSGKPVVRRRQPKGKENAAPNVIKKAPEKNAARKTKPAPDFSKIHQKWQSQLAKGKAVTKKPNTKVEAFELCGSKAKEFKKESTFQDGEFTDNKTQDDDDEGSVQSNEEFQIDNDALESILSNRGIQPEDLESRSRTTIAGLPESAAKVTNNPMRMSIYYAGPGQPVGRMSVTALRPHNPPSAGMKKNVTWASGGMENTEPTQYSVRAAPTPSSGITPSRRHRPPQQTTTKRDSIYYTGPRKTCSTRAMTSAAAVAPNASATGLKTPTLAGKTNSEYCPLLTLVGVQGNGDHTFKEPLPMSTKPTGTSAQSLASGPSPGTQSFLPGSGTGAQSSVVSRVLPTPCRTKLTCTQSSSQPARWADFLTPQRAPRNDRRATPMQTVREEHSTPGLRPKPLTASPHGVAMETPAQQSCCYRSTSSGAWSEERRGLAPIPNLDPKMTLCFDDVTQTEIPGPTTLPLAAAESKRALADLKDPGAERQTFNVPSGVVCTGDQHSQMQGAPTPRSYPSTEVSSVFAHPGFSLETNVRPVTSREPQTRTAPAYLNEMRSPRQADFATPARRHQAVGKRENVYTPVPFSNPRAVYPSNRGAFPTPGRAHGLPSATNVSLCADDAEVLNASAATPRETQFRTNATVDLVTPTIGRSAFSHGGPPIHGTLNASAFTPRETQFRTNATVDLVTPTVGGSAFSHGVPPTHGTLNASAATPRETQFRTNATVDLVTPTVGGSAFSHGVPPTHGTLNASAATPRETQFRTNATVDLVAPMVGRNASSHGLTYGTLTAMRTPVNPTPVFAAGTSGNPQPRVSGGKTEFAHDRTQTQPPEIASKVDTRPVQVVSPTWKSPTRIRPAPDERSTLSLRGALSSRQAIQGSMRADQTHADTDSRFRWEAPTGTSSAFRRVPNGRRPTSESFQAALLDMEVSLLTGAARFRNGANRKLTNPLAKIFTEGDSQCFVPIED